MYKNIAIRSVLMLIALMLSACIVNNSKHGYDSTAADLKQIKVNQNSKEQVEEIMGSPSTVSTFDDNIWYYMTFDVRQIALFPPTITHEKVIQLKFQNNILTKVAVYDKNTNRSLGFNKETSEVQGDDQGMMKDFFLNIGRFNKLAKNTSKKSVKAI